jgi:hypothetical protein
MNLLWVVLSLFAQKWYYLLLLYVLFSATNFTIPNTIHSIFGTPFLLSSHIHGFLAPNEEVTVKYAAAVSSGFGSLQDLFSNTLNSSMISNRVGAYISVDDAVFQIRSSQLDCHGRLVEEFELLRVKSMNISSGLMDFRAHAFSTIDL